MEKKRKKAGLPPGTLIYTGRRRAAKANIILLQYNKDLLSEQYQTDQIPEAREGNLVNWYDIRGLSNISLIENLGRRFEIHPLVLEDILNTQQRPKVEDYPSGVFLIVEALSWQREELCLKTEQIAIYTTATSVLSFQEDADDSFTVIRERLHQAQGRIRQRNSDYLTYCLLDYIIDQYYGVLDQIETTIEEVEQEIISDPNDLTKSKIHRLRLAVLQLRKISGPTREAVHRLYRIDHPVFCQETAVFVRDLYDHLAQINDTIDNYREIINGLYDLYLSEISYKVNNVIQVLTIVSTIFIPLTFLVGVYGMNFNHMPELQGRYSYFALWGIMILIFMAQLLYFRRKKWL